MEAERRDAGMCFSRDGGGDESKCKAVSQWYTGVPHVRSVQSLPETSVSADPRGKEKSSIGTCSTSEGND